MPLSSTQRKAYASDATPSSTPNLTPNSASLPATPTKTRLVRSETGASPSAQSVSSAQSTHAELDDTMKKDMQGRVRYDKDLIEELVVPWNSHLGHTALDSYEHFTQVERLHQAIKETNSKSEHVLQDTILKVHKAVLRSNRVRRVSRWRDGIDLSWDWVRGDENRLSNGPPPSDPLAIGSQPEVKGNAGHRIPDLYMRPTPKSDPAKKPGSPDNRTKVPWHTIHVPMEVKLNCKNLDTALMQLWQTARLAFSRQPHRLYMYGILLSRHTAHLVWLDRCGSSTSEKIDLRKRTGCDTYISVIGALSSLPFVYARTMDSDYQYCPIERSPDWKDPYSFFTQKLSASPTDLAKDWRIVIRSVENGQPNQVFRLLAEPVSHRTLIGRATFVYPVRQVTIPLNGKEDTPEQEGTQENSNFITYALKQQWRDFVRIPEGVHLARLKAGAEFEKAERKEDSNRVWDYEQRFAGIHFPDLIAASDHLTSAFSGAYTHLPVLKAVNLAAVNDKGGAEAEAGAMPLKLEELLQQFGSARISEDPPLIDYETMPRTRSLAKSSILPHADNDLLFEKNKDQDLNCFRLVTQSILTRTVMTPFADTLQNQVESISATFPNDSNPSNGFYQWFKALHKNVSAYVFETIDTCLFAFHYNIIHSDISATNVAENGELRDFDLATLNNCLDGMYHATARTGTSLFAAGARLGKMRSPQIPPHNTLFDVEGAIWVYLYNMLWRVKYYPGLSGDPLYDPQNPTIGTYHDPTGQLQFSVDQYNSWQAQAHAPMEELPGIIGNREKALDYFCEYLESKTGRHHGLYNTMRGLTNKYVARPQAELYMEAVKLRKMWRHFHADNLQEQM